MSSAARAFWSMYYLNYLKRENMISQEEYSELLGNRELFPLYNKHVTEYNIDERIHQPTGGLQ